MPTSYPLKLEPLSSENSTIIAVFRPRKYTSTLHKDDLHKAVCTYVCVCAGSRESLRGSRLCSTQSHLSRGRPRGRTCQRYETVLVSARGQVLESLVFNKFFSSNILFKYFWKIW